MADNERDKQVQQELPTPQFKDSILEDPALSLEEIKQAFQIAQRCAASSCAELLRQAQ